MIAFHFSLVQRGAQPVLDASRLNGIMEVCERLACGNGLNGVKRMDVTLSHFSTGKPVAHEMFA
jgi:hypothetical protein